MYAKHILQLIGNTPLVQVPFDTKATVLAKLEYLNPGGSLKDRSALFMIEQAERSGKLKPGGTIIEASSGNQGIAAALIGAAKGYKVVITTNHKFSKEKINTIKAYGAQIVVCEATEFVEDPRSYHSRAIALHKEIPNSFLLNQYQNLDNSGAHYASLGPEIWNQTEGAITHFFAAAGTCGTITGVGRYLKEKNPAIQIIAVDAATSYHATRGNPKPYCLEGIGIDFESPLLNTYQQYIDHFVTVTDQEGIGMIKYMAKRFGIFGGPSSGAVAAGIAKHVKHLKETDVAVMLIADSGRAYLSKAYLQDTADQETPAYQKEASATLNAALYRDSDATK